MKYPAAILVLIFILICSILDYIIHLIWNFTYKNTEETFIFSKMLNIKMFDFVEKTYPSLKENK